MIPSLGMYRDLWLKGRDAGIEPPGEFPGWPQVGIAVMGDFAGIQPFVLRPVPGAGGAAKRLRSRSFRVSAYTKLVGRWCEDRLASAHARLLYSAGGRFLIGAGPAQNWRSVIEGMQRDVDSWAWESFQGELAFHLAGAEFSSGRIPAKALISALDARRSQPLAEVLIRGGEWDSPLFFRPAGGGEGRCQACGSTQKLVRTTGEEEICKSCYDDEQRGFDLGRARFAHISQRSDGDLAALGMSLSTYEHRPQFADGSLLSFGDPERGAEPWYLLRHLPTDAQGRPLDFDEVADCSPGSRKWLGYLRVDVDGAGRHFRRLEGDPLRTWALSRLLDLFFAKSANDLLAESRFKNIYAVYGGGDDLFVIGPWADSLEFARELRGLLRETAGDDLTFSAGMALAKPREHILTQAERAQGLLDDAKNGLSYGRKVGRDQLCALGTIADWQTFAGLIDTAKQVTQWVHDRELPSSLMHRLLELHEAWETGFKQTPKERLANPNRYRPLLHYQIQRNIKPGRAADWAKSLLAPGSQWPWVDFIARYAMLAGNPDKHEGG